MLTLFVVILTVLRVTHMLIHRERFIFYKEFYSLLSILYFLLLYYLLLSTEKAASGINLIPFKEITRYPLGSKLFFYNVVGNIMLFIPFGYIVSDYLRAKKITPILCITILISLTAELIQYRIGRAFDIDDIFLNVVGGLIGFMIYISIQAIKNHLPRFLRNNLFYNIVAILFFVILVILFGSIWGVKLW